MKKLWSKKKQIKQKMPSNVVETLNQQINLEEAVQNWENLKAQYFQNTAQQDLQQTIALEQKKSLPKKTKLFESKQSEQLKAASLDLEKRKTLHAQNQQNKKLAQKKREIELRNKSILG